MDEINKVWSKWKTVEIIGQGGFGTVYKVKRETFDQVSYGAVKVIKIPTDSKEVGEMTSSGMDEASIKNYYKDMVYKLLDEIKTMERFKSASHIVNIEDYEVVENEDDIGWTIFIRMELLTNLNKYMKTHTLNQNDVVKLGIHICKALEYCQENNIIHRDIKPGNIFVSDFGEYKLGDFGISREIEKTNATLSQKGTKSYMAPEMIKMEKYGRTVDLYALGLTMYEILNHGRMPFLPTYPDPFYPADRENAMLKRLTGEEFPNAIYADDKLNDVIRKACSYDPKQRYQTATEMKKALENCYVDENQIGISKSHEIDNEKTVGQFGAVVFNEVNEIASLDGESLVLNKEENKEVEQSLITQEDNLDKTVGAFGESVFNKKEKINTVQTQTTNDNHSTKSSTTIQNENHEEKPKKNIFKIILACILALCMIVCLVKCSGDTDKVVVPNLAVMTGEEAQSLLEDLGLKVNVNYVYSDWCEKGKVITQSLKVDKKVEKGTEITIEVSKGKKETTVSVPNVKSKTESEAKTILQNAGLEVSVVYSNSSSVASGKVISQSPKADSKVNSESTVTITVSKGKDTSNFNTPNVVGKNENDAKSTLENSGLKVTVKYANSDSVVNGKVISQSPKADSKVSKGTTITITVSKGKSSVSVPNVNGKSESDAKTILQDAGLKVNVKYSNSDSVTSGKVISQSPNASTKVDSGSTVTITVSKGKSSFTVPSVVGKSLSSAKSTLEGKGLVVKVTYTQDYNKSKNVVVKQSPSDSLVTKGDTVTITVNEGAWSDYVETLPSNVTSDKYEIESITKYSYRDKEYTTSSSSSLSGWTQYNSTSSWGNYGSWSSWSGTAQSASDSKQVETRTEYRYYFFYCPKCGGREPLQGKSDCGKYTLTASDWNEKWFPTPYSKCNAKSYSYTTAKKYTESLGDGKRWNFSSGNINATAVGTKDPGSSVAVIRKGYRYRTRSLVYTYYYYKWGNWTSYSTSKVSSSDTREVRTKTYYRYSMK